ncbi:NAD(P)H-dependent oxidoreductase subunit E [Streptomyces vietnamensis]|uniref:NAD(P)H-dependent oxidoreductase subunit E n=1 Tax=Streptomyces vietnamensis TaxID=362257 RepID=UPI0034254C11
MTARHGGRDGLLPAALERARAGTPEGPEAWAPEVAAAAGLPAAADLGPATFFADLAAPRGERRVRVCTATACFAARGGEHLAEVERALGVVAGRGDEAGSTSLRTVHCLGYRYAGPAALDGTLPRTGPDLADQRAMARLRPRRSRRPRCRPGLPHPGCGSCRVRTCDASLRRPLARAARPGGSRALALHRA